MTEWNEKLESNILRKSKWTLMSRIIRSIVLLALGYLLFMSVLGMLMERIQPEGEHAYYSRVAIDWTVPNVRGGLDRPNVLDISPFGTQTFRYHLIKKVGHEEVIVGDVTMKKALLNRFSSIEKDHPGKEQLQSFSFSLPENPNTGEKVEADSQPDVWKRLEMLPEGTVGELAFSTNAFMSPEELIGQLEKYDLEVLWMPLYTGEFMDYTPSGWSGDGKSSLSINYIIGLTGGRDHDEDFRSQSRINTLDDESIEESKQMMLQNMEELLEKNKSYYEGLLGLGYLKEKQAYLKEKGFTVYGAVVTGPVKELLKLKDVPSIRDEQLGDVELWNW